MTPTVATENLQGYFRELFHNRPDAIWQSDNTWAYDQYRIDHGLAPDAELNSSVKNALAGLKTNLRKNQREEPAEPRQTAQDGSTPQAPARSLGTQKTENGDDEPGLSAELLTDLEDSLLEACYLARELKLDETTQEIVKTSLRRIHRVQKMPKEGAVYE